MFSGDFWSFSAGEWVGDVVHGHMVEGGFESNVSGVNTTVSEVLVAGEPCNPFGDLAA